MPTINRPRTYAEILQALEAAKAKADVTAPADLAFTAATLTRLTTFLPTYQTEMQQMGSALGAQSAATIVVEAVQPKTQMFISHYFQVFNFGIEREVYQASDRAYYMLDINHAEVPNMRTEQEVAMWGARVVSGDAARVAAGGAAMANPSAAQVAAQLAIFTAAQGDQSTKKDAYDHEQEDVATISEEALDIVDDIWDECEFTFRKDTPSSKRRKCREYGVVYKPRTGETPSPDDFSIMGTVTNSVTGLPLGGVAVITTSPEVIVLTDAQGKYYVPKLTAGTYQMTAHKDGYLEQTFEGIVVTDGTINTIDVQLSPLSSFVIEGDALPGTINDLNTSGFTVTPSTTVQIIVSGNLLLFSAAPSPGPIMGATVWNVSIGTQNKTYDAFKALVGASDINTFLKVQCAGPGTGHYKITFNNVIVP